MRSGNSASPWRSSSTPMVPKSRPWAGTTPSRTSCTSPFVATCTAERSISPLRVGDEVDVVGMAPEAECQHEMFVLIPWERRALAVPLVQLKGVAVDDQIRQVIEDRQYWVAQGYEL